MLLILLLLLLPSSALSLDTLNDDVLGLIVFKAALKDPQSQLSSWTDSDDNPCKWRGVQCDPNTNRVTDINLDGFSLSGEISRGLLRLQFLQRISLSNNNFSGEISRDFSSLWSLQLIDFSGNSLSGSIPGELFQQCGSLKSVSFANNMLSGELPVSLSSCMSLESIDFSYNQLNGQLSPGLWSLSGLQSLDISNNLFEGEFPGGIGKMYGLRAVDFSGNGFSGFLPVDIGDCSQLQSVNFGENLFSGGLPKSMKKLKNCTFLSLNGNLLDGELPHWIGQLNSLENLDLSGNKFSGEIPDSVGDLAATLTALNLSSNGFSGDLPVSLKTCSQLVSVDISRNLLDGDLPNWVFDMGLHSISLAGNRFTGSVQFQYPATESMSNSYLSLETLDLSSNQISGVIPSEIDAFSSLMVLNLSTNLLFGAIPPTIGRLGLIQVLDVSNNRLNGSIAVEIGRAVSMRELRLDNNLLTGYIPSQIGNLSSLTTLILKQNNITGEIPATIANLKDLKVADFSSNNLIGALPKELTYLSQLQSFNISYNHLEGELPDSVFFNSIPLSSVTGNPSLCGSVVNKNCPSDHPKPIVLNPNSSIPSDEGTAPPDLHKKKLMLSISALVAIGAAAFIFLGVVTITILNLRVRNPSSQRFPAPISFSARDDFSQSPVSDSEYGKLVMFAGEIDFGEGAHALLSKDREIGRGGFGTVYHTILRDGRSIAIKKLSISSLIKSRDEFEREVKMLGNAKHHNLVELQGYYWTSSLQLLITEFVTNGSLFDRLHEDPCSISWHQRLAIITGIAKGLAHLHQMDIIHYNLKSTNVLLDSSNDPKVGDFGLARLIPNLDRYILSSKIQSALGYMAPEFACRSVKITEKCDVYGFGILVLEIVTGKKPVEYMEDDVVVLCDMVREALDDGNVDKCVDKCLLEGEFDPNDAVPVIKLGLVCASQVPSSRPEMAEVVNILEVISRRRSDSDSERIDLG